MHLNSFMPCSLLTGYISRTEERLHSVYPSLSLSMKAIPLLCLFIAVIILGDQEPYYIPHDYYDFWMVVDRNSSGQLYFNPTPNSRRVFIWKPYNASIAPTLFFEDIRRFYKTIFRQLPQEFLRELLRRMFLSLLQQLLKRLRKRFPPNILPDTFWLSLPQQPH